MDIPGKVTRYRLDGRCSILGRNRDFSFSLYVQTCTRNHSLPIK